ncbi:RimJ/RimL family protein N-acetyltransferase [Microvirga flocculans]|uniref:RimJ/RimL family protein N-acetyltransferase n=1 Tax=Microvirga flocculans TaxID=217168 RepID=A0A7W6IGV9_9HYPH|nr:GNAT family N-acetyltransferase [Microvirga flocculans]MBB4041254.1 RimJ/RimL family protein N-acetyltransferase [Microvirga flocculans]
MSGGTILVTERLRLCPWQDEDFPLFAALHGDPDVQRFLEAGEDAWDEPILREKFARFRADYAAHGWSKFKALDAQGRFVGRAGFSRFDETGELELGYSFRRDVWGQGYATEVASALLRWIYGVAPIDHVIGFAVAEHKASRRVLEKAGMTFTGLRGINGIPNAFYRHDRPA